MSERSTSELRPAPHLANAFGVIRNSHEPVRKHLRTIRSIINFYFSGF